MRTRIRNKTKHHRNLTIFKFYSINSLRLKTYIIKIILKDFSNLWYKNIFSTIIKMLRFKRQLHENFLDRGPPGFRIIVTSTVITTHQ
jgi:hypothetical protein